MKFIISILVFGIMAFVNGDADYVQKIVNASQDAAQSQTGQIIVGIL